MSHGSVTRKTIYFGAPGLAGTAMAMSVPGPASAGGFMASNAAVSAAFAAQPAEKGYQRLDLPPRTDGIGPVVAITIAPDSAIQCCDIAFAGRDGEMERHRVSPGNPYLGCVNDADFALVSVPNCPPPQVPNAGDLSWDSRLIPISGITMTTFPLRLEIWRGCPIPIRSPYRAPYHAYGIFETKVGSPRSFFVCLDGRRKVQVALQAKTNNFTIIAAGLEARPPDAPAALSDYLDSAIQYGLPLNNINATITVVVGTPTCLTIWDASGGTPQRPSLVKFSVEGVGGNGFGHVKVSAWDDY